MYTSIHVILSGADSVVAAVPSDREISPALQLYHQALIGGPLTITFGDADHPLTGLALVDRVIAALHEVRDELVRRSPAASQLIYGRPITPKLTLIEDHGNPLGVGIAGAGDPDGVSPDAPALDDR